MFYNLVMLSGEYYVAGRSKVLSRTPSSAIEAFAEQVSIYHPGDGGMCDKSTVNTIGGMLLSLQAGRIERIKELGLAVPLGIDRPVEVLNQVPISIYTGRSSYRETGVIADEVLFKRCGRPLGLVLNGELAGLFVRPIRGVDMNKAMSVTRVWDDADADPRNLPYQPNFTDALGTYPIIVDQRGMIEPGCIKEDAYKPAAFELTLRLKLAFEQLIREAEVEKGGPVYNLDLLFKLGRRLNLNIDEAGFHYTRDPEYDSEVMPYDRLMFAF
jgi:hypothetical protein